MPGQSSLMSSDRSSTLSICRNTGLGTGTNGKKPYDKGSRAAQRMTVGTEWTEDV